MKRARQWQCSDHTSPSFRLSSIKSLEMIRTASLMLDRLIKSYKVDSRYDINRAVRVWRHVNRSLSDTPNILQDADYLSAQLAALLYAADSRKFCNTTNNQNARRIITQTLDRHIADVNLPFKEYVMDTTMECIDLVSCRENLNSIPPCGNLWKLLPRYANRLESMGNIGIFRAYYHARCSNDPIYVSTTPVFITQEDIIKNATVGRFLNYSSGKKSDSMIDHFFDKLLHLSKFTENCPNEYMIKHALIRHQNMIDFLVEFSRNNRSIDEATIISKIYSD